MKVFALVGKPNVGKSTLYNRLAKKRLAIVHEQPGVTRDRNLAMINYKGFKFFLIDTGGFEPESKEAIPQKMREQSQLAVEEADGILFITEKDSGWTPQDEGIFEFLRRSQKPVYFAVNKIDSEKHEASMAEFYESGCGDIFPISAAHGRGIPDLLQAVAADFPEIVEGASETGADDEILSIAIVGRPNAGKSSLLNQFVGENKQIVHDSPGTTRDPVDHIYKYHGQSFRLIDTAGIRKKSRVSFVLDKYSMVAALKSIERADVVLLVIDAAEGVVEQDARIAGLILERGKAVILVINKWDLVEKDSKTMDKAKDDLRDKLSFVSFAPSLFISAKTGQRVHKIMEKVLEIQKEYQKRIQTSDLNQILQSILARHQPPSVGSRRVKLFYATQVATRPPTFIITSNAPNYIRESYHRFMMSQFRHFFGFEGTPIRIFWRDKNKRKLNEEA